MWQYARTKIILSLVSYTDSDNTVSLPELFGEGTPNLTSAEDAKVWNRSTIGDFAMN